VTNTPTATITLVVIAYNEQDRIVQCLSALLNQSYEHRYEVVVVDDGSTDATSDLVRGLSQQFEHIGLIALDKNRGRGIARKTGIDSSDSDVIGFVDADIIVPFNWLSDLMKSLETLDAVCGIAQPDGDVAPLRNLLNLHCRLVRGSNHINGSNVLFRRTELEKVDFPQTPLGEDFRIAELLKREGARLETVNSVVVEHKETKSYSRAIRWLFQSGIDSTRLLIEFRNVRLPDVVAFGFTLIMIMSVWGVVHGWNSLWSIGTPFAYIFAAAALHALTRFKIKRQEFRIAVACVLNAPLMASYLFGRVIGAPIFLWEVLSARNLRSSGCD
jgi:glycosyltransferase involved in cell wall biosynthesis